MLISAWVFALALSARAGDDAGLMPQPADATAFDDRGIEDYDTAIRLKPDYQLAFKNRGRAKFYVGRFSRRSGDQDPCPKELFQV